MKDIRSDGASGAPYSVNFPLYVSHLLEKLEYLPGNDTGETVVWILRVVSSRFEAV